MTVLGIDCNIKKISYKNAEIQTYSFGTGPNIVLALPPFPASGIFYLWSFRLYDLSKIKIITLDVPGWAGHSDNVFENEDYSLEEYVEIIKVIVNKYKIQNFSVIGYSFGGALAIRYYYEAKDKIKKVALISPVFSAKHLKKNYEVKLMSLAYKFHLHKLFGFIFIEKIKLVVKSILKNSNELNKNEFNELMILLQNTKSKQLLHDANELMNIDLSEYIKIINPQKLMLVNSKNEVKYFKQQAEYIRKIFNYKINSLEIIGKHEDFLLRPNKNYIKELFDFLISD